MNKTLIDNSANLKMVNALRECISASGTTTIRIATGYWDIPGTSLVVEQLKEFLEKEGTRLQLLIGKDPYVYAKMLKEPKYKDLTYPQDFIRTNIDELADNLHEEHKAVINLLLKYCADDNQKIEIRIFKKNEDDESQFLHSKCYIFTSDGNSAVSNAIIGSSNFTQKGLEGNSELNYLENDYMRVAVESSPVPDQKSFVMWFNEKWEQADDWTKEFLEQILKTSKPVKQIEEEKEEEENKPLTPYEVYIKLLQTKFGSLVDKNLGQLVESYLPTKYDTYEYQIDAVKQCYATMKEHGGFMLADVVGLGKTIVGTLLIKHFLSIPDEDGRERKVLVVTPPAIQSAWKKTIADFDRNSNDQIKPFVEYITTGSIGKLVDDDDDMDDDANDTGNFDGELKHDNYGLILIDESHKFRNSDTSMYQALDELISEIGAEVGAYPYIGLLSATPQNNRPNDLKNQIYLFERNHSDTTLKKANGGNLESFFSEINKDYDALVKKGSGAMHSGGEFVEDLTPAERQARLIEISRRLRDYVLSDIMVRRTRTDVERYYSEDLNRQGIIFPKISGPHMLEYKMSSELAQLFADTMQYICPTDISEDFLFDRADSLCYYRYRAIQFLNTPENKQKYKGKGSRDADKLAIQLAKIMQIGLVKRLESSFTAFRQSLINLRQYTQNMIDMWENDTIFVCPQINVNAELDRKAKEQKRGHKVTFSECVDDIRKKIEKLTADGRNELGSNTEYTREDFNPDYLELLKHDYEIISELCDRWSKNSEDPKFDEFKEQLRWTLFNKETNRPQKLVIFSEAIDTVNSICKAAESKGYRVLNITAKNRNDKEQEIRENFDANYGNKEGEVQRNDYDIIVTTDVLAEGINLHRANCILNYDTPWNSTRLMQRIGRVNRIGSTEPYVYVYNFMPSAQGDAEIGLVRKAHTKLQSFHTLFGEDSQVFSNEEEVAHYDLNTEVNGEESPIEKYVYELKQYKEEHPERYAVIEQKQEGLEMATTDSDGNGLFLVRTPKLSGLFVKVNPNEEEGEVISMYDMLEQMRPDKDAAAVNLPEGWSDMKKEAERVVTAELASVRLRQSNSKRATDAKAVIIALKQNQQMSPESKKLLNSADRMIRQGNNDIIKRILHIGKAVEEKNLLFPYTQEEFDKYLSDEIEKIVANVQKNNGKPEVFIGMYK